MKAKKQKHAYQIPPSRQGKTVIAGHFEPDIKRQLKVIAAKEDTSIQALLDEALADLIKKRGA